ncbi:MULTISPECIES: hypothetical protein [unclassified Rhizobium]|uniref:hypothetical protein n=1 Tax=unclassified Rhizobium TaxID=2613769 RepID=UPI0037FD246B
MENDDSLFQPAPNIDDDAAMIADAVFCVEAFTDSFNMRDLDGMDAHLHFPHVILSGEKLIIWTEPGNLPASFFDDLHHDTGWVETRYQCKNPVLVSPRKVHLVVEYTRNRDDGAVASSHQNLWIVTFDDGRWGIKQRSY